MGTYSFVLEFDAAATNVYLTRGTLRAYRHSDNPMTVYVRTEDGPMDLSSVAVLEAIVLGGSQAWPWYWADYGMAPDWRPLLTVSAYSPTPGRVLFTLPMSSLTTQTWGSTFTLFIRADGRTVYQALLEVVD